MYLDFLVDIPDVSNKITYRNKSGTDYVYYEYSRDYSQKTQTTNPKRATIGKRSKADPLKMQPNQNFLKYFPDAELPEEKDRTSRSSCLRIGDYIVIRKILEDYIARVMPLFEQDGFTERAEEAVGCRLAAEAFCPTMVTSIQGGAEAIDISSTQDIFGISRSPENSFLFIGHEFIIYLLKRALCEEDAFRRFETWEPTEGLAEYYLKELTGRTLFAGAGKWTGLYARYASEGNPSAAELYRKALAWNAF